MKFFQKFSARTALFIDGALLVLIPVLGFFSRLMIFALPDTCTLYRLGLLCPACGGTRCIRELCSGNFFAAYGYNKFVFCAVFYALVGLVLYNLACLFKWRAARSALNILFGKTALITIAFLYILFGIMRNVI